MNRIVASIILGFISLILGPFGLIFSVVGLFLAISALKTAHKKIKATIPVGYKGKLGKKQFSAQPFINFDNKFLVYFGIGLNSITLLLAALGLLALGILGGGFLFLQNFLKF